MIYMLKAIHYCLQMYWKILEINVSKYAAHFLTAPGLVQQACLKNTGVKLALLTNNDMLIMVEIEIRGGTCHEYIGMQKQIISI